MPGVDSEAVAIEARGRLVQSLVVECGGERALLEVAADDGHRVDRSRGGHAEVPEGCDQAAARSVREREVVDRRREDVRDLLGDELLGRGHADVERVVECTDRAARLLAEGGVGLVAEDEVVRLPVELRAVPGEPRVRLDRDRIRRCVTSCPSGRLQRTARRIPPSSDPALNCETSSRRCVRIRTPRVRAASTNPAAAIVFPDAVGCRNR